MLCGSCGKNDATIHYTKIINGKTDALHLCDTCASDYMDFDFDKPFSIHKFFTGLIDTIEESQKTDIDLKCDNCGMTYNKFRSAGKFGCSKCYETFNQHIDPLIKGLHGHNTHAGKIPKRSSDDIFLRREEEKIRQELEHAIKCEEFEIAATLRDKLKGLKTKLESHRGD